jgi:prepilin-type N-terminal cleavage/methylation domain-containing protein
MKKKPGRSTAFARAGFTLIEGMLALVVVGIGVTAVLFMDRMKYSDLTHSGMTAKATRMIESYIERTRMQVANNPTANFPPRDTTWTDNGITLQVTVSGAYDNQSPPNLLANVKKVVARTSWTKGGRVGTLRVVDCISKSF